MLSVIWHATRYECTSIVTGIHVQHTVFLRLPRDQIPESIMINSLAHVYAYEYSMKPDSPLLLNDQKITETLKFETAPVCCADAC